MGVTININGLSLVHKGSGGVAVSTPPDVCKTPPAPVPVPYVNVAFSSTLSKGTKTIKVDGGNSAAINGSEFSTSIGDEPGVAGGVKSGVNMKEATWISYSPNVIMEGKAACRLTDKMHMNHMNTVCLAGLLQSFLPPGQVAEGKPDTCDHNWEEVESHSPEEAKARTQAQADSLAHKPSEVGTRRGLDFENSAIDKNMDEMDIQKASVEYRCSLCGQDQEVDIVGKDQVAEAKSRNFKGVKNKRKQSTRIRDIQQKLHNPNKNPRAKLDGSQPDHERSASKYRERGFDVEVL